MDNNYLKRYSIQNMGIHGKLVIIQSLLVIIPFLVLFYAFYHHRLYLPYGPWGPAYAQADI